MQLKTEQTISTFNYIHKILIVLNAPTGGVLLATVVGAPVGIASFTGFTIVFALATGIVKKILKTTRNKFLCWLKVNSIALKL